MQLFETSPGREFRIIYRLNLMKSHLCFYSLIGKIGMLHACVLCQISDLSYCCFGFVPSAFNWSCYNAGKHFKVIHTNNIVTYGLNFCQMSQLFRSSF